MADATSQSDLAVLMVTRRFWPLTDDAAGRLSGLAEGARRGGIRPTILAARYSASWPRELMYREIPVVRPVAAPRGDWSGALYGRGLVRWIREHVTEFDLLYADNMRDEGLAVVEAAQRAGLPSLVRCGGTGAESDVVWAQGTRAARRALGLAARADAIVAPHAAAARALISRDVDRRRVHRIDDGIPTFGRRDAAGAQAARIALGTMNSDLRVPAGGRVILFTGTFSPGSGAPLVAEAIAPLLASNANWRLWMFGDGPLRDSLHAFFRDLGVRNEVAMPGCIGHIDELWQAADVFIAATGDDGLEHRLPSALGAGVPVVAADVPEIRALLGRHAASVSMFDPRNVAALAERIAEVLGDYPAAQERAERLKQTLRQASPREHAIEAHLRLMRELVRRGASDAASAVPETDEES